MDIVLGVSMAPAAVQMVLVEGERADGVTVDHDDFAVGPGAAAQRVLAAILGTREGAREGGYQLASTGVTFTDQAEAAALRATLVDHKVENVMLISAFLAAAALAQAVGSRINHAHTGLLFIEPEAATLAVVSADDGSIGEIRRQPLPGDDNQAVAALTALVAGAGGLASRPDGLFVVGSGVNVAMIKPELDRVSPIPVSTPEDPELALARGAALASAHAPLFSTSTRAMAWALDPGTGAVDPALVSRALAYVPPAPVDYSATSDHNALAYSAAPDYTTSGYLPVLNDAVDNPELTDSRLLDFTAALEPQQDRKSLLVTGGVAALFVVGVVALAGSLAVGMRSTHQGHPDVKANVVTHQAPPPAAVPPPAPPPPPAPKPEPVAVPVAPAAPPPAPEAPAPAPEAPPPPPPAAPPPPPPPELPPILQIPGLPGGPPLVPPGRGGWEDDDGWGRGGGHGRGRDNDQIPIPLPIPGLHLGVGF